MEEKMTENDKLDSWDEFASGTFLKAADVESPEDAYVCVAVDQIDRDGKLQVRLHLQRNKKDSDFDLNKTNARKLKKLGVESPKAVVGKNIYFLKALARNPSTNKEVESLRISKIE